jgi:hypothetical protein
MRANPALHTRFFKHSPTDLGSIEISFILAADVAPRATQSTAPPRISPEDVEMALTNRTVYVRKELYPCS